MSWGSALSAEFKRLGSSPDAHQRGRKLEELLERLFQQAHFRVQRNAGIARPRQTDLVASYGDLSYLIEAKWLNTPADVDVFDAVRARLERAASASVLGVIISVSGFTKSVVEEVVNCRGRQPVLLLGEEELTQALRSPESLVNVLRVKRNELVTHGRVDLAAHRDRGHRPADGRRRPGLAPGGIRSRLIRPRRPDERGIGPGRLVLRRGPGHRPGPVLPLEHLPTRIMTEYDQVVDRASHLSN
jgi:Restriction endonuclease